MEASVLRIPNFVKARDPKRLRVLMLKANSKHGMQHDWINITYVAEEKTWYAWYYVKVEVDMLNGEIINGD